MQTFADSETQLGEVIRERIRVFSSGECKKRFLTLNDMILDDTLRLIPLRWISTFMFYFIPLIMMWMWFLIKSSNEIRGYDATNPHFPLWRRNFISIISYVMIIGFIIHLALFLYVTRCLRLISQRNYANWKELMSIVDLGVSIVSRRWVKDHERRKPPRTGLSHLFGRIRASFYEDNQDGNVMFNGVVERKPSVENPLISIQMHQFVVGLLWIPVCAMMNVLYMHLDVKMLKMSYLLVATPTMMSNILICMYLLNSYDKEQQSLPLVTMQMWNYIGINVGCFAIHVGIILTNDGHVSTHLYWFIPCVVLFISLTLFLLFALARVMRLCVKQRNFEHKGDRVGMYVMIWDISIRVGLLFLSIGDVH